MLVLWASSIIAWDLLFESTCDQARRHDFVDEGAHNFVGGHSTLLGGQSFFHIFVCKLNC